MTLLRWALRTVQVIIVLFSTALLISRVGTFVNRLQLQGPRDSEWTAPAGEAASFCESQVLNYITVIRYMDTVPRHYYSWDRPSGQERELAYYEAICSAAVQIGRPLTGPEAYQLADYFVIPRVELIGNLASDWWLWLLAILSGRSLYLNLLRTEKTMNDTPGADSGDNERLSQDK